MITGVVTSYIEGATASGYPEEWDLEQLWTALRTLYPISLTVEEAVKTAGGELNDLTREFLVEEIVADAHAAYDQREEELGTENTRELERRVLLSVLDRKWREHLYEMDYLQEGIGLRAMAQRDPLVEYQREGFDMFTAMMDAIQEESVGFLFNLEVEIEQASAEPAEPIGAELDAEAVLASLAAGSSDSHVPGSPAPGSPTSDSQPHISAKGLDHSQQASAPLTYSAPALGSDTPEVHTEGGQRPAASRSAKAANQRRANPNRGSRGNKRKR
jgi:preprotein translocase subunit SecA